MSPTIKTNQEQKARKIISKKNQGLIIFDICEACTINTEDIDMSVPQGAFAARKVRKNMEKRERLEKEEASKYNSKYMNSIWGMYNRFSVHNLKKVMDSAQNQSKPGQDFKGMAVSSQYSVSIEKLSHLPL